jgi:hypothetical protein
MEEAQQQRQDMEGVVEEERPERQEHGEEAPKPAGERVSPFTFQPALVLGDMVNVVRRGGRPARTRRAQRRADGAARGRRRRLAGQSPPGPSRLLPPAPHLPRRSRRVQTRLTGSRSERGLRGRAALRAGAAEDRSRRRMRRVTHASRAKAASPAAAPRHARARARPPAPQGRRGRGRDPAGAPARAAAGHRRSVRLRRRQPQPGRHQL